MVAKLLFPVAIALLCARAFASDAPPGASILDPDIVWDVTNPHSAVISPDGRLIAYISKGALWSCSVTAGPPTKLADLPDTITALVQLPEYEAAKNKYRNLAQVLQFSDFQKLTKQLVDVYSLSWTPPQDGVVYALRRRWQSNAKIASHRVLRVALAGAVSPIAVIERDVGEKPQQFESFHVAANGRLVVVASYGTPLIWNASAGRPQATSFDFLTPSSTSERYLGVEIDTRQLVLVDKDFRVLKRFDVNFKAERQCDVIWSADERFAICRRKGQVSDKWIALRVDLRTGAQRQFKGDYWTDQFAFTGHGGEFMQSGIFGVQYEHLDQMTGAHLTLVPDGDGAPRDLVSFRITPAWVPPAKRAERPYYPPVLHNPDFSLFAMALPRTSEEHPGFVFHLIDRQGRQWPVAPDDPSQYLVPGHIIGFADDGRTLVARNDTQLFSMPVASIAATKEGKP